LSRVEDSDAINELEKSAVQKGHFSFLSKWITVAVQHKRTFDAKAVQYRSSCILVAEDIASVSEK
jgi:hypothetical protein